MPTIRDQLLAIAAKTHHQCRQAGLSENVSMREAIHAYGGSPREFEWDDVEAAVAAYNAANDRATAMDAAMTAYERWHAGRAALRARLPGFLARAEELAGELAAKKVAADAATTVAALVAMVREHLDTDDADAADTLADHLPDA